MATDAQIKAANKACIIRSLKHAAVVNWDMGERYRLSDGCVMVRYTQVLTLCQRASITLDEVKRVCRLKNGGLTLMQEENLFAVNTSKF